MALLGEDYTPPAARVGTRGEMERHASIGGVGVRAPVASRVALLAWLVASACVSRPDPRLPPEIAARVEGVPSPRFHAHLSCESSSDDWPGACDEAVSEVRRLLSASPWFDSLETEAEEASLLLSIRPLERTPYWHSPGHNPGAALLALVVPLPWRERAGYRMTATVPGSGRSVDVDTRREPRTITWSLAPLLNLSPDRSFAVSDERELARIHAQLLPLVDPEP